MATTTEEREIKIKIFKDFYKEKGRFAQQREEIFDNELNMTGKDLYDFVKYLLKTKNIEGIEEELLLELDKKLQSISESYKNLKTTEEKKQLLGSREQSQIIKILDGLLTSEDYRDKTFEVLQENGITNPEHFFTLIGFDFENNLTSKEHNQKINFEKTVELSEKSTADDLYKVFLTDNFEKISDEELHTVLEKALSDLFEFEKTEINGWFIEVIKNDLPEIQKVIKQVNESGIENQKSVIQFKIFELINQRGVKTENGQMVEPFQNLTEMKGFINFDFSISNVGMPDILYFPKNKSKEIVANNISSSDDTTHSYSIFHHFYKLGKISDLTENKIHKNDTIFEAINENEELLSEIIKISKQKTDDTFEDIQKDLETKSLDEIFDIDKISFTAAIKSSTLTVFNQQKSFKKDKQNDEELIKELKEVEKINTLIFFLSLIGDENMRFGSKSDKLDIEEGNRNNKIIESIFEKINIGILSGKGFYTETSNNEIEKSIKILLDYISNKETLKTFEEHNMNGNDYTDNFKYFMQNVINYITNYYTDILVDYQKRTELLTNNKLFSACVTEKKLIQKEINTNNTLNIRDFKEDIIDNIIDDIDSKERRKSLKTLVKQCSTIEQLQDLKNILESIEDLNNVSAEDTNKVKSFRNSLDSNSNKTGQTIK